MILTWKLSVMIEFRTNQNYTRTIKFGALTYENQRSH